MIFNFIIFVLSLGGLLFICGITPADFSAGFKFKRKARQPTMKQLVDEAKGIEKINLISRQFKGAQIILEATGRGSKYGYYRKLSLILAITGAAISILIKNFALLPVLTVTGMFIPLLVVNYSAAGFKKRSSAELETALSIITGSYLRTGNIVTSVSENVDYIHQPVKDIFVWFLAQCQYINPDIEKAIAGMKMFLNNGVFHEWCDTLILCQKDRNLKDMLEPIVSKLSDIREVQNKLNSILFRPIRDFMMMLVLSVIMIPVLFFLKRSWFLNLFLTMPGKISLAVLCAALLISIICVINAAKPLEYRR
ncbi:MAG TPA: hypothetical protein VHO66_08630 [Ruminiclostridium sp.]|nr:hypothetical protein [Ruminiclostridium sp.]